MSDSSPQSSNQSRRRRRRKPPLALTLMRLVFATLGRLFPRALGAWAYRLWFSTRRFRAPRRETPWLAGAEQQRVPLGGFDIMTYNWTPPVDADAATGLAPLVVLVHGWNGRGSQMAAFAAPLLEAGFRVTSFDAPGHGLSPGKATNIFEIRDVLCAIARREGPIHAVIAHSFGGMVTSLALSEGLQVKRAVLLSSPAQFELLVRRFCEVMHMPQAVHDDLLRRIIDRFGEPLLSRISPFFNARQLAHIPVLIIHDAQDWDVPVTQGELIAQHWPGAQLQVTEGLGHKRILYHPAVLEQVRDFLLG